MPSIEMGNEVIQSQGPGEVLETDFDPTEEWPRWPKFASQAEHWTQVCPTGIEDVAVPVNSEDHPHSIEKGTSKGYARYRVRWKKAVQFTDSKERASLEFSERHYAMTADALDLAWRYFDHRFR